MSGGSILSPLSPCKSCESLTAADTISFGINAAAFRLHLFLCDYCIYILDSPYVHSGY